VRLRESRGNGGEERSERSVERDSKIFPGAKRGRMVQAGREVWFKVVEVSLRGIRSGREE